MAAAVENPPPDHGHGQLLLQYEVAKAEPDERGMRVFIGYTALVSFLLYTAAYALSRVSGSGSSHGWTVLDVVVIVVEMAGFAALMYCIWCARRLLLIRTWIDD